MTNFEKDDYFEKIKGNEFCPPIKDKKPCDKKPDDKKPCDDKCDDKKCDDKKKPPFWKCCKGSWLRCLLCGFLGFLIACVLILSFYIIHRGRICCKQHDHEIIVNIENDCCCEHKPDCEKEKKCK